MKKKRKRGNAAKQATVYVAREMFGLPVAEIALQTGKVSPRFGGVTNTATRVRAASEKDATLARRLERIRDRLSASQEA
ncbi:MAG: hypothetical protein RDV41_03810 [Planctomycetota bacterium]|nr:hypothetical protein [Planctomycetota bacterium]